MCTSQVGVTRSGDPFYLSVCSGFEAHRRHHGKGTSTEIVAGLSIDGRWSKLSKSSDLPWNLSSSTSLCGNTVKISVAVIPHYPYSDHVRITSPPANLPPQLGGPPPTLTFDRFVRACVVVKKLHGDFRQVRSRFCECGWPC